MTTHPHFHVALLLDVNSQTDAPATLPANKQSSLRGRQTTKAKTGTHGPSEHRTVSPVNRAKMANCVNYNRPLLTCGKVVPFTYEQRSASERNHVLDTVSLTLR